MVSLFNTPKCETSASNRAHSQRQNSVCIVVVLQSDPADEALNGNTWQSDCWSENDCCVMTTNFFLKTVQRGFLISWPCKSESLALQSVSENCN